MARAKWNNVTKMGNADISVNLAVVTEPAHRLVEAAQPANVDTVMIDGGILKRGGRLTSLDVGEVVDAAARASAAVRRRSGWSWSPPAA